jgi:steroid delta-isomerase-like uncharacterized protein
MPLQSTKVTGNKQVAQRFMEECWSKGNLKAISEFVTANCLYHDPVFPHLVAGVDSIRDHIANCRRGFPDIRITIDDTIAEGNEVVHHWTITGTHRGQFLGLPPTNKKATLSGTSIFRIRNAKIVEQWSDWNLMSLMEQLGVASAPTAQAHASKAESKTHA